METLNGQDLINSLKVYLPTDKKTKTKVRGFWKGGQGLCYDYIRKVRVKKEDLRYLKKHYKQECLFYTRRGRAYTWYNPNKVEELHNYRYFTYNRQTRGLKGFLKNLLANFGGFTIYIREGNYLAEVWL